MPAKVREFTPVRPRGGLVHATSLERDPERTLCGRPVVGWIVEPAELTCEQCLSRVSPRAARELAETVR